MTPEQVTEIVERALRDWHNFPWQAWLLTVIILGALVCLGSYLAERGKQRAIREVLKGTTQIVEEVRSLYAAQLEDQRLTNQLRLAALEERLKVHQEAYVWWRQLVRNCNKPKEGPETAFKCQEWWMEHCLYLSGDVRDALYKCFWAAFGHAELLREPRDGDINKAVKEREENWQRIMRAGEIILGSVSLLAMPDEKSLTPKELSPPKQ